MKKTKKEQKGNKIGQRRYNVNSIGHHNSNINHISDNINGSNIWR